MSRKVSESVKKRVAGKQNFKCANSGKKILKGLENYVCPLWQITDKDIQGIFNESGYEIDHIIEHSISQNDDEKNLQALCLMCHSVKTKRFITNKSKNDNEINNTQNNNSKQKYYFDSDSDSDIIPNSKLNMISSTECNSDSLSISEVDENIISDQIFDSESDEEHSKIIESRFIKIPTNLSIWKIAISFVDDLSHEKIICGYDKTNHGYSIYKFNESTTLYESISSDLLTDIVTNFIGKMNKDNIDDIIIEICRLSFIINLNTKLDNYENLDNYINGYYLHGQNILCKRTPEYFFTKCKNDYLFRDIMDYVNTFYILTNNNDKVSKDEFMELYMIHSNFDNINWNNEFKILEKNHLKCNSSGFFTNLKKIILSCNAKYYERFYKNCIVKTNNINDTIHENKLIKKFNEWYIFKYPNKPRPTNREIIYYFSIKIFKLSSKNGDEFPITKFKIEDNIY